MFITIKKDEYPKFMKSKEGYLFLAQWDNLGYIHGWYMSGPHLGHTFEAVVLEKDLEDISEIITISQI